MRDLVLTSLFVLVGVMMVSVLTLVGDRTVDRIALVFPIGWSQEDVFLSVAEAGGRIIGFSALDNIVVASFEAPDGELAISKTNALFSLDPAGFGGCNPMGKQSRGL